jgi:hypothetical protein
VEKNISGKLQISFLKYEIFISVLLNSPDKRIKPEISDEMSFDFTSRGY